MRGSRMLHLEDYERLGESGLESLSMWRDVEVEKKGTVRRRSAIFLGETSSTSEKYEDKFMNCFCQ